MDILDILMAKKKSFTGETEKLTRQANEAMAKANEVAAKIEDAEDLLSAAQTANETAQSVAENLESLQEDIQTATNQIIDNKISTALNNLNIDVGVTNVGVEDNNSASYKSKRARITKNNTDTIYDISKNYTATGSHEDGSMTQKAITDALTAQKTELEAKIHNSNGSGNISGNLIDADPGSLVIVGDNGNIASSTITENDLIQTQILLGNYIPEAAVGIEIDYDNKITNRIQEAIGLNPGTDFDKYPMYGGRKRCLVADDGEILAFENDENYTEDGSLGQVMVYQPKFYYFRSPLKTTKVEGRTIINKEIIYISAIKQSGFKIFPTFLNSDDNELDYILLPAYEGGTFDISANQYNITDEQNVDVDNDLLASVAGIKPTSNISVTNMNKLATNRGQGWSLTNLAAISANQMLMIIEFGSLNLQSTFNKGITKLNGDSTINISCNTGATTNLGSTSGMALSTTQYKNGSTTTYTEEGTCAISYRGMENPYGNIWHFIGDAKVIQNNNKQYLTYKNNRGETKIFGSAIPANSDWISYFGYDENATWAFIPTVCQNANSAVPVGDYVYISSQNNNDKCCVIGGKGSAADYAGPFYYGMDYNYDTAGVSYGGELMYTPNINTNIYSANIAKWRSELGGE